MSNNLGFQRFVLSVASLNEVNYLCEDVSRYARVCGCAV